MSHLIALSRPRPGWSLEGHLAFVSRFPKSNQNAIYIIVGRLRTGKSTLARRMAKKVASLQDLDFSVRPIAPKGEGGNVVYPGQCITCILGGTDYMSKGSSVVTDEAIKTYFSRNSGRSEQKDAIIAIAVSGYQCLIQFYLVPKRRYADVYLREDASEFLIDVWQERLPDENGMMQIHRGFARFYHADTHMDPFSPAPWFNEDADFTFEDDPDPEYEYYKDIHTRLSKLGYEAPWQEIEWKPGAKTIPTQELMEMCTRANEVVAVDNAPDQRPEKTPKPKGVRGPKSEGQDDEV